MVIIPSRIGVESYQSTKELIDGLVGSINGRFGNLQWLPVVYQYRSLRFPELSALYNASDVALVTPLRDGMNLIAKEYIASRTDQNGVLILSEMAGAVEELDESIVINPNNIEAIGDSIGFALEMSEEEQRRRVGIMQERVRNYDVMKWADDYLASLQTVKKKQARLGTKRIDKKERTELVRKFRKASTRLIFLDYDGTLIPHTINPSEAQPSEELLHLLESLLNVENTRIVIISGRDRNTLDRWFGRLPVELAAEHGLLVKNSSRKWQLLKPVRANWKRKISGVMRHFANRLPGSFIEEKEYSVAFHYRKSDAAFASLRVKELANYLASFTSNMDVQLLYGNKALEVRNAGIDKGVAALYWLSRIRKSPRFILAIGNDQTDEDLFRVLPPGAYSIKVGLESSYAKFNLMNPQEVRNLLAELAP